MTHAGRTTRGFRERLAAREELVGTFAGLDSAAAVEVLGWSGFDFVCVDTEHGAIDFSSLVSMVRAAEVAGTVPLVRVAEPGAEIGRALDAGARGVIVPRIESGAQAADAVAQLRYPPHGRRGAGPGRAQRYGMAIGEYLQAAETDIAAIVQVETHEGLERAEEIARTPGLDLLFIGPGDLSVSLGAEPGSPTHAAAVERIARAGREAGVPVGIFVAGSSDAAVLRDSGVTLFTVNSDLTFLAHSAREHLADTRLALEERS